MLTNPLPLQELEKDKVYRTTYMFSATMPPTVERLARKYLRRAPPSSRPGCRPTTAH